MSSCLVKVAAHIKRSHILLIQWPLQNGGTFEVMKIQGNEEGLGSDDTQANNGKFDVC